MATVTQTTLLEEALEAWGDARRGVVAELSNVTARDVDFRPAPGARSGCRDLEPTSLFAAAASSAGVFAASSRHP